MFRNKNQNELQKLHQYKPTDESPGSDKLEFASEDNGDVDADEGVLNPNT